MENLNEEQEVKTPLVPVFKEAETMTPGQAIDILIQAAVVAQSAGRLNVRDSVFLAKAIEIIRPGSI
jgi:hypothetical protein